MNLTLFVAAAISVMGLSAIGAVQLRRGPARPAVPALSARRLAQIEDRMWWEATDTRDQPADRALRSASTVRLDRVDLARRLLAAQDFATATRVLSGVLHFSPEHPRARLSRGVAHYFASRYEDALRDLVLAETLGLPVPATWMVACRQRIALG
ncbi:MAG: hypothetical protein H6739_28200 [Alphaproteobacteria bacterium]|nr:hypothetical protein [Alphaproteobacteria bacterium]